MNYGGEIGVAVGLVLAAALALQTALGPVVATIVEAIKATGALPRGWSGVASLGSGVVLGATIGVIAWNRSGDGWFLLIGAFAGLLIGAGGVSAHQNQVGAAQLRRERRERLAIGVDNREVAPAHRDMDEGEVSPHTKTTTTIQAKVPPAT